MGYRMSKQKALGYSPYFLMFGKDPILQSRDQPMEEEPLDQEATAAQMELFLSERGQLFRRVMPLAFRNLAIAQQRDIERYRLVDGTAPKPPSSPGTMYFYDRRRKIVCNPRLDLTFCGWWNCGHREWWCWRGVMLLGCRGK